MNISNKQLYNKMFFFHNLEEFDKHYQKIENPKPIMFIQLYFYTASWCPPCQNLNNKFSLKDPDQNVIVNTLSDVILSNIITKVKEKLLNLLQLEIRDEKLIHIYNYLYKDEDLSNQEKLEVHILNKIENILNFLKKNLFLAFIVMDVETNENKHNIKSIPTFVISTKTAIFDKTLQTSNLEHHPLNSDQTINQVSASVINIDLQNELLKIYAINTLANYILEIYLKLQFIYETL